ncbi:transcriptional adapter 2-alpha isoform X2 [Adelges cooleyi]|uniref:transcriptional adapter 2-alpha isoform X2 n=1 Tax=Adelges cooleyi TaxID=133065 RepID=UPI00217FECAB|nr:transcriptional adapter 2-alpha isoform X2 [Adelges cooleyi]
MYSNQRKMYCRFCFTNLWHEHTFIKCANDACAKIGIYLCLNCFSAGTNDDIHNNTDPYNVLCNAIQLDNCLWPAHEEILLLNTFSETMNWEKVAQKLGRSSKKCEQHYFEHIVFYPKIKELVVANQGAFRTFDDDYVDQTQLIESFPDRESFHQYELAMRLAGYQPLRGEFDEEYDDQAEDILKLLNEPIWMDETSKKLLETDFYKKLCGTIADIFNERLQERYRRRKVVKDYGLVCFNKQQLWIKSMETILGPEMIHRLIRYLHLIKPLAFDFLITNLKQEHNLLARIHKLIEFRRNGITKHAYIGIYEEMNKKRENSFKNKPSSSSTVECSKSRINVCNLPGYQKLDEDERELCTLIKMLPESYLKFKELLRSECEKSKGISLKTARSLIKIDVNKTRKMYNLLIEKALIWQ